jgi:hypothetical protein
MRWTFRQPSRRLNGVAGKPIDAPPSLDAIELRTANHLALLTGVRVRQI